MPAKVLVVIPDLFESFLSRNPDVNSNYHKTGEEAMEWISEICNYTSKECDRLRRADFAYFAAIAYHDANENRLRTVTDWFNWVFAFDDQLDDGPLGHQKEEAFQYIDGMMDVLKSVDTTSSNRYQQPSRYVLSTIWKRLQEDQKISLGAKQRWMRRMTDYFTALKESIGFEPSTELDDTIERYIHYRRNSISVTPLFSFLEYTCELRIPDFVFEDQSFVEIETIGVDLQMLANDCVSYHRERDLGCAHNIIHLYRFHGLSEQEAYDRAHNLLRQLYRKWYLAHASLPIWGEQIDQQVQRYIKGIQDVALANAHWSFRSERYFGKHRQHVRQTREVEVAADKADWLSSIVPKAKLQTNAGGNESLV